MVHPLVLQLRFTRGEFKRAVEGVTDVEARHRFLPMNCISWNVGHLAWQEQRYWLYFRKDQLISPQINDLFAYGAPASAPPLSDMLGAWQSITEAADPWLDSLTSEMLAQPHPITINDYQGHYTFGSLMQRVIYHYWYHTGENMAIRQMLGQRDLPEFVGNIDEEAPYVPE